MKRQHRPTSKEGEQFIAPFKPTHQSKIVEALDKLKVGGTFEEIAAIANMKDSQVWKRLSELEAQQRIFNTGLTRKLKSGVKGIVWQVIGGKSFDLTNPKTEKEQKEATKLYQLKLL